MIKDDGPAEAVGIVIEQFLARDPNSNIECIIITDDSGVVIIQSRG